MKKPKICINYKMQYVNAAKGKVKRCLLLEIKNKTIDHQLDILLPTGKQVDLSAIQAIVTLLTATDAEKFYKEFID